DHPVDYVARQLPGKRRKELRRVWRRLDESVGGGLQVVDLAEAGRADEGVETFLRLEAAGWKGADGGAIAHHADQRAFFVEACRALHARGALSVLALLAGDGSAVAVLVDVREGDTVFTWKTAYDEQHAAHSPGLLLYIEQLRRFPDTGAALVDTCADPGHPMADRLHPDRRELVTLAVALRPGAGEWAVRTAPRLLETVDGVRHRWRARHDRPAPDRTRAPTATTSAAPRTTVTGTASTATAPTTPEEARP
ncbi:GNAT family N-acetyltransferase, partial [Nocardioides kribbensis]|uniref:GNAT family N-acetyltransferase n=1 Tax=Nocardioides kribbensis TaxID=305517 RepID=UPI0032DAB764